MKKRSRAYEAGSMEAGSSISKSIFFANRVDGALVGQPNQASWGAQERTEQANRASEKARGNQIEPFKARSTQQGRQGQPDQASRGQTRTRQVARLLAQLPARARTAARRAISLWIIA